METVLAALLIIIVLGWLFGLLVVMVNIWEGHFDSYAFWFIVPVVGLVIIIVALADSENYRRKRVRRMAKKLNMSFEDVRVKLYPSDWWLDPDPGDSYSL